MANFNQSGKWKKRALAALSVTAAATLSLGIFAACGGTTDTETEESKVAPTDTQLIKNGNFEFYSDQLVDLDENGKPLKKFGVISSPDNWTFTSGSPSSETQSGIVNVSDWSYFARSGGSPHVNFPKGEDGETTFVSVDEAAAHWTDADVTAYDRLKFLQLFKDEIDDLPASSEQKKLFAEYKYSIDFDDVKGFEDDVALSSGAFLLHEGADADETSVLMIHNDRTADDGVRGTAQYYTSSTTVTLSAGTAAKVSVWVRTDNLYHYKDVELKQRGGAYIGVTNTVGGTTLDQMQIFNINTEGSWQQYTLFVRASTFATSTFRIVLGLGQGNSDDKYFAVDGYAFFDDVECEIISSPDFETEVLQENGAPKADVGFCTVDSLKEDKLFNYDEFKKGSDFSDSKKTFALDLYAGFDAENSLFDDVNEAELTSQKSGSNTFTSAVIDESLGADAALNFAKLTTLGAIKDSANKYLSNVYQNDFADKYPFGGENSNVVMLLSGNGAAYTLKLHELTLEKDSRMLVSFFVKTSKIQNGLTGATATVVDGETRTSISAFDSTTVATVDIDNEGDENDVKDIYDGWVQCFFFLQNDTDEARTFHIELSYGPTTIVGTNLFDYGDGYAAFTNFETKSLTRAQYSYASTGDRARKVSLTGGVEETKKFDSVSSTAEKDLETAPALPANFRGVLGGSNFVVEGGENNVKPENVFSGLLNYKYAEAYRNAEWSGLITAAAGGAETTDEWWSNLFGNARQPLVILNETEDALSYGYFGEQATVSANSYSRISMNVKVSNGAVAHIYLTDVSSAEKSGELIYPNLPNYTYWYDDDGNIVNMDPSDDLFDKEGEILFELQSNGLYTRTGTPGTVFYANLHNYEEEKTTGNLLARNSDGAEVVFYHSDGKYYAYYDEETDRYDTEVVNLPTEIDGKKITRYAYAEQTLPGTEIVVEGNEKEEWVTVSFYIHTGDESKDYRLEVWSGDRLGKNPNPAGSYVFFDNLSVADASSNFTTLRDETVSSIKDELNAGKNLGDPGFIGEKDNLPESYKNALYYTFTFFDSAAYMRYDESTDTEGRGNPWGEYVQSSYEESLVYLYYEDNTAGQTPRYSFFLDYASIDETVEENYPVDAEPEEDDNTGSNDAGSNIWLLLSSGVLAIVLIAVILIIIVRRLVKKFGKRTKIKAVKNTRRKPAVKGKDAESDTPETPEDDE